MKKEQKLTDSKFQAFRLELEALYQSLASEIAETGVVCRMRGECCNFDSFEHILFASNIEILNLIDQYPLSSKHKLEGALCPYWENGKCSAHQARPLGCRIFFCDQNYIKEHSQELYEKYHKKVQALIQKHGFDYAYLPMVSAIQHYHKHGSLEGAKSLF